MNPELLQAYYWLSSAIAQAFAALIALTAMFYIYRIGALNKKIQSIVRSMIPFIDLVDQNSRVSCNPASFFEHLKLYPEEEVVNLTKQLKEIKDTTNGQEQKEKVRQLTENYRSCESAWNLLSKKIAFHKKISHFHRGLKFFIISSIILSALAMAAGIAALLLGNKLCLNQKWILMIGETILAAVALGWTVYTVIRMLREPEEPQAKEGK